MKVAWFSCGATSAVACKLALSQFDDVDIVYIETGSHHPDNTRFLADCEKWYDKKITILQSPYQSHFDVIEKTGLISMPHYVPCTKLLKMRPREEYEAQHPDITHYIWGFEKGSKEENRAKRMVERYQQYKHIF